jgi:hypothetical protein
LKIRNPWGSFEFAGKYGDDSDLWTPSLKAQVGFVQNNDDGLFFMTLGEFTQYFTRITICFYKANYQILTLPVK